MSPQTAIIFLSLTQKPDGRREIAESLVFIFIWANIDSNIDKILGQIISYYVKKNFFFF